MGTLLNPLNSSMFAVGLVSLSETFSIGLGKASWIVTAFYITSAIAQPTLGRLADRWDGRPVFLIGMSMVCCLSVAAPFAPTFALLCGLRVAISVGTAAAYPAALALVRTRNELTGLEAKRVIARIEYCNVLGVLTGPVVGGTAVHFLSWKALFWVSAPLALISLLTVRSLLPATPRRPDHRAITVVRSLDLRGIVLFATAPVAGLWAVNGAAEPLVLLALSAIALALLVHHSRRISEPFFDVAFVRRRSLWPIYASFLMMTTTYYLIFYGFPQLLEVALGWPLIHVGFLMLPLAGVALLANPACAVALRRLHPRTVLCCGTVWMAAAAALLPLTPGPGHAVVVGLIAAALGVPHAISTLGSAVALYNATPRHRAGSAFGLLQTSRHVGGALAMAALAAPPLTRGGTERFDTLPSLIIVVCLASAAALTAWRP
ncbi:MFS transporter [Aeromicrobium phragmitis]|uniref:MFS transporter n=2 Tax=Aeromicrobium phragmitis TaxID=2478914 RepID=A0A3L8PPP2_9ACTN|nr:MFS transporter [Aeromicrobium phragmitis]